MNNLWIFNPDNDIALGNNLSNFTPPRNARLLREAGAMLMAWIAGEGDYIVGSSSADAAWLETVTPLSGKNIRVFTPEVAEYIESARPWGWSRAIADNLSRLGIPRSIMPDDGQIQRIRELSHRHSSVIINQQLESYGIDVSMPIEVTDVATLEELLRDGSGYVIKSPWSSSGRGVIYSDRMNHDRILDLSRGIIRNQGCILVEPKLDKLLDFAMLFDISEAGAKYIGLSVFSTLPGGNYAGNIIAPESHLNSLITRYVDAFVLEKTRSALEVILTELIGDTYKGVCGIDMMVYTDKSGSYRIAPCVELNLRNTMGYVSHRLARDIISPQLTGSMTVTYIGSNHNNSSGNAQSCDAQSCDAQSTPIFDNQKRLISGSLSLIPPNNQFDIRLSVD
ncbi:MAG: hypothetical protein HDS69_09235 [Bacteroidales bacterium]|nr:hypothetical protein [Bacteroidales bacterium]